MKSYFFALITGLLLAACVKTDTKVISPEDPDWIRLEAPTGGEALDVAGNINSTLYVATDFKLYKTTNQGKSWESIWSGSGGLFGVVVKNDTIYLMRARVNNSNINVHMVVNPSDFSVDGGKTWNTYRDRFGLKRQVSPVKSTNDIVYSIKPNIGTDGYVNPSDIIREIGSTSQPIRFPFKHEISALLLDSKGRLYVAVSGTHIPETNRIYCCPDELPSVVYVSKRALP